MYFIQGQFQLSLSCLPAVVGESHDDAGDDGDDEDGHDAADPAARGFLHRVHLAFGVGLVAEVKGSFPGLFKQEYRYVRTSGSMVKNGWWLPLAEWNVV